MAELLTVFGVDFIEVVRFLAYPAAILALLGMVIKTGYDQGGYV